METQAIDMLFLELSQVTKASTAKEILLMKRIAELEASVKSWRECAEKLQASVCQSMVLLNQSVTAQCNESSKVHEILRTALCVYADDYMEQPVTEAERQAIMRKHQYKARKGKGEG